LCLGQDLPLYFSLHCLIKTLHLCSVGKQSKAEFQLWDELISSSMFGYVIRQAFRYLKEDVSHWWRMILLLSSNLELLGDVKILGERPKSKN
jgi:hypothetical protein